MSKKVVPPSIFIRGELVRPHFFRYASGRLGLVLYDEKFEQVVSEVSCELPWLELEEDEMALRASIYLSALRNWGLVAPVAPDYTSGYCHPVVRVLVRVRADVPRHRPEYLKSLMSYM